MKKQLLTAVIATVVALPSMASISITGKANFEYTYRDYDSGNTINGTDTEINLNVRGKQGDTGIVLDLEFDDHGNLGNKGNSADVAVENSYITTKVGPVNVKAGNWSVGESGVLGEIELGGRESDRVELSYAFNGFNFYTGLAGNPKDDTQIDSNMYAGVVTTLAGWKLELKKNRPDLDSSGEKAEKQSFGVKGKAGPVGVRFDYASSDADEHNGFYLELTGAVGEVDLKFATIQMDANGGILEDDSGYFVVSNNDGYVDSDTNTQLSASTNFNGIDYSIAFGQIGSDTDDGNEVDYYELAASKKLVAGTTLKGIYQSVDDSTEDGTYTKFEIDLSVAF